MRRGLTLAVVAGAVMAGTPALALLAPDYYRKARESAPDVVVVKVHAVAGPAHGAGFGDCAVAGTVTEVERGTRYRIARFSPSPCALPQGGRATHAGFRSSGRSSTGSGRPVRPRLSGGGRQAGALPV